MPQSQADSPFPPAPAAVRIMLADQERRLLHAASVFAADPRERFNLLSVERMLARIRSWQGEGDLMVVLAPGFMGANGYGPLIDLLCRDADLIEVQGRSAAS